VSVFQNLLINSLFLLVINFFTNLWLLINFCSIMYINTDAVAVSLNKINIMYLINLFTIINMLSNHTFHVKFFNNNNFIIKFIVTDFHSLFSTLIYVTLFYCLSFWILFFWHNSHLMIYFIIWFLKSSMLHFYYTRFSVLLTSRCSSI